MFILRFASVLHMLGGEEELKWPREVSKIGRGGTLGG